MKHIKLIEALETVAIAIASNAVVWSIILAIF